MRRVFADTFYWIALANPSDQWHQAARNPELELGDAEIVTTEEVLTELLATLAGTGRQRRVQAAAMVRAIMTGLHTLVCPSLTNRFSKVSTSTSAAPTKDTASPTASP